MRASPAPSGSVLATILDPGTARDQGAPLLDPRGWTPRHRVFLYATLTVATLAGLVQAVRLGPQIGAAEGLRTFLAVGFGAALIGMSLSLRGITVPGFLIGGFFIVAGILSWAYTDTPLVVWAVLLIEGVLFLIWTFPWLRELPRLPRLGTAWLGLGYWFLGLIGAVLVVHITVAAQRLAYTGLFTLAALGVITATRKSGRDMSIGIVSAFGCAIGLLFLVGAGNALNNVHVVPNNAWGAHMQYRFWGGPHLLYHPNSIAVVIVVIAIRIGADRTFERWQRYAAVVSAGVVLLLVNSRTGWLYLSAAAGLHALLVLRQRWVARRGRDGTIPADGLDVYPSKRAAWAGALLPIVLAIVVGIGSGGLDFLTASRYANDSGDLTSGRTATWAQVWREFKVDDVAQKIFGDAKYARGYIIRTDTGTAATRPKLTIDDAPVGSLRRGGILGVAAFLLGLVLMIAHAIGGVPTTAARAKLTISWRERVRLGEWLSGVRAGYRTPPAWFTIAAIGSLATMVTAEWLLGGTGGTLWIYLLAGEMALLAGIPSDPAATPVGAPGAPIAPGSPTTPTESEVSPVESPATAG